jgi:hypothetical protein
MGWICDLDSRNDECMQDFDGEPIRKQSYGRPKMRWDENIKVGVKEMSCEGGR